MRLVNNRLRAQAVLEEVLEESKPPMRAETAGLDYLLSTPFRYPSPYGSRFRGAGELGVFYGAERVGTACAELGYWRWRFVMESEGLRSIGLGPTAHTVFQAGVRGPAIDLREAPFVRSRRRWTDRTDYTHTQAFARSARAAHIRILRYQSVRDPEQGGCAAVLHPDAFQPKKRLAQQTWHLTVTPAAVIWQRDGEAREFDVQIWR
ncbi:MAG TPA: RES family NAD+ phosphorylase [Steroidobacteraceae bacterium]|nr:RES family NAD+ phosphorylase [Steroidobacteraceae bacterium]